MALIVQLQLNTYCNCIMRNLFFMVENIRINVKILRFTLIQCSIDIIAKTARFFEPRSIECMLLSISIFLKSSF